MNEVITKNPCETFVKEMKEIGKSSREIICLLADELVTEETLRFKHRFENRKSHENSPIEMFHDVLAQQAVAAILFEESVNQMRSRLAKPSMKGLDTDYDKSFPKTKTDIETELSDWLDVMGMEIRAARRTD